MPVGGRVPDFAIEPVKDAVNVEMAVPQELVQAAAAFVGHDLAGIGRADGADHGRVIDAARHEVHLAEALLGQAVRHQAEVIEDLPGGGPLVAQVVDGVDGRQAGVAGIGLAGGGQPGDGRRRVPVVGVDHVGPPAEGGDHQVEGRPAEEGEAVGIVAVAVEKRPIAEAVPLGDEVDRHVAAGQRGFQHAGRHGAGRQSALAA